MRIHSTALGQFVPGWWSVPQNPISGGMGALARLADFVPAMFTVPQNPVGMNGLAAGDCGCGCGGGCGGGMGDITTDLTTLGNDLSAGNFAQALQDTIVGVPAWVPLAGIVAAFVFADFGKGSRYTRGRRAASAAARAY